MGFEATATQTALCNGFIQQYWSMIKPVHMLKNSFKSKLNELETMLAGMVFSTTSQIAGALESFEQDVKNSIPGDTIDAIREIQGFTEACQCFFGGSDGPAAAVGAVLGGVLGIYDQIDDYLGQIAYPEFGAGTLMKGLNALLDGANIGIPGGGNISELLAKADCMASCMSGLCPGSVSELNLIVNDIQDLYSTLQLDDDPTSSDYGKVKYNDIFSAAGMTPQNILNMNSVNDSITGMTQDAASGVSSSVGAIKDAVKGGFF